MANAVLTAKNAPGVTAKLVAKNLIEHANFIKSVDKESPETWQSQNYAANPGDTIYIKKPPRFTVGSTLDVTSAIQDLKEEKVALTLNILRNVAFKMTSLETAYDRPISYWNDNFVAPATIALAAEMEKTCLSQAALAVSNLVGTSGTQPGAIDDFLNANQLMFQNLCPQDDNWKGILNPATNTKTTSARKGLFQSSDDIRDNYRNGYIGTGEGFSYLRSNLLPTFQSGTATGSITVTTTSVNGATTIALTGTGSQTLKAGQVFTIANVYDVHPLTKQQLPNLKQFVVTADNTASGGAYTNVAISPTIYDAASGGSLQNVSQLPTSTSTVTLWNSATSTNYQQNLCYHPSAFRFVSVPLYTPNNMDFAGQETVDGITVRALRGFDIRTSESIMRFDILGAFAALRPEWACRVAG